MEDCDIKLKKQLGLLDVFCISTGAMISSGLFVLPGLIYSETGPAMLLCYFMAGFLMIPAIFSRLELSTAMPKSGGSYFHIERSLGTPAGTLVGMAVWLAVSLKGSFALVGIGSFVMLLFSNMGEIHVRIAAALCCLIFTYINLVSVRKTSNLQILLVMGLLAILGIYIILGLSKVKISNFTPFMPFKKDLFSVLASTGAVFISYAGVNYATEVAEEIKDPGKNLPLGIFLGFFVVQIMYISVIFITIGILPPSLINGSMIPIALGAKEIMGVLGLVLLSIASLMAYVTTANAGLLAASRSPLAMSKDELLPEFFSKISPKYKTPYISILFTSLFMVAILLSLNVKDLVKTAATFLLLLYILDNLSLIIMRESKIQSYRPLIKTPFYPYMPIFGILAYTFLIVDMGFLPIIVTILFMLFGLCWFLFYVKPNVSRQSALIHVVERITANELKKDTISDELRDILLERDNITEDRFDALIKNCEILDIEEPISFEQLFELVSQHLTKRVDISAEEIKKLLLAREAESTTVIRPGLAIPHLILPGENKFDILLVRCVGGVEFSKEQERAHIIFVLAGSKDERNYHLKVLMSIAQITELKQFDSHWATARNIEDLRNIVLLASRRRHK